MQIESFADGKISARVKAAGKKGAPTIVALPGGPGISGRYMDPFIFQLAEKLDANAIIIDLPNHDESEKWTGSNRLKYDEVRLVIFDCLEEISARTDEVTFIGHSMGAFILFDLLRSQNFSGSKIILVSTPVHFNGSAKFSEFLKKTGADYSDWSSELEFSKWWRKVLPAYFLNAPSTSQIDVLASVTFWEGNENFLSGAPSLSEIASDFKKYHAPERVLLLQGFQEMILPDSNSEQLSSLLSGLKVRIISNSGHFPMLENVQELREAIILFLNKPNGKL